MIDEAKTKKASWPWIVSAFVLLVLIYFGTAGLLLRLLVGSSAYDWIGWILIPSEMLGGLWPWYEQFRSDQFFNGF